MPRQSRPSVLFFVYIRCAQRFSISPSWFQTLGDLHCDNQGSPCNAQDQANAASLSQLARGPDQYWWKQDEEGTAARSYQEEPNETKADTTSKKVCPTPHLFLKPIMNHVS